MGHQGGIEVTLTDEMRRVVANLEAREWIQGAMQIGEAVCAHAAVMTCQGLRPGDAQIIRAVMRAQGITEDWNDTEGRTKDEVLERMRSIEVSDADLADTFGPGWLGVVAVIRRAAILTEEEAQGLVSASDAVLDVAWVAAREAAWAAEAAAWNAAEAAALRAARPAARAAASAASWAALAQSVTHLVGQHGLEQRHIDTLMQPWITVLGADWAEAVQ